MRGDALAGDYECTSARYRHLLQPDQFGLLHDLYGNVYALPIFAFDTRNLCYSNAAEGPDSYAHAIVFVMLGRARAKEGCLHME